MTILNLTEDALETLAKNICIERDSAVNARKKKGLDALWHAARERYEGREPEDQASSTLAKGETLDTAAMPSKRSSSKKPGSTVVLNITRPYVNAGTALVSETLLTGGKLPYKLKPTPVSNATILSGVIAAYPTLMQLLETKAPDLADRIIRQEEDTAFIKVASTIIRDWLKETSWAALIRTQIEESGKVGAGVIKGPFPKRRYISTELQEFITAVPSAFPDPNVGKRVKSELEMQLKYTPHAEIVKVENCYPDGSCGSNHQNGRFFFEKVPEATRRMLSDYMEDPSYDAAQIKACLDEGPKHKGAKEDGPFELWIRTGTLTYKEDDGEKNDLGFQVTILCNKRILKSEPYWLENEQFPYWILPWLPREGSWDGIGISEQIETPQRGVVAAVRALMDNMGYSVGPQVLELDNVIEPADGNWDLYPYKRWKIKSALPGTDAVAEAKSALTFLEFPNYLNEIMPVINFWLKEAEDTTGLSLLLQGKAVTDAVGVSQQLMANATTVLRQVIKNWDDEVCEPQLTAFFDYVQLYGPPEAKGDAQVEALGSSVLIIRELQQQAILQLFDKALQPIYGLSPKKLLKMYLEGQQINFEQLEMDEDERQQLQDAENQPDPKIVVAEIEAQAEVYKADVRREVDNMKTAFQAIKDQIDTIMQENALELEDRIKTAQLDAKQVAGGQGKVSPEPEPAPAPAEVEAALTALENLE